MARIRRPTPAQARRETHIPFEFAGTDDGGTSWLDWRGAELRLRDEGGGVVDAIALPDARHELGRLEFGRRELETLGEEGGPRS